MLLNKFREIAPQFEEDPNSYPNQLVLRITDILKESNQCSMVVKNLGLVPIITLLERSASNNFCHSLLRLINQLIEESPKIQEQACLGGVLPSIIRFGHPHYAREIRVESAYFIGQLSQNPGLALQIFVGSGGLEVIVNFLDINYGENKDLILMAIDCISLLKDCNFLPFNDLVSLLAYHGAIEKLVFVIDCFINDQAPSHKSLEKAMEILLLFSLGGPNVKERIASNEVLPLLLGLIHNYSLNLLVLFCKILKNLAADPYLSNVFSYIFIL